MDIRKLSEEERERLRIYFWKHAEEEMRAGRLKEAMLDLMMVERLRNPKKKGKSIW